MRKGDSITGEYRERRDAQTGARIHQLTDHPSINHGLFFLNPSFRPRNSDHVAFVTHRAGHPQLCLFDFATQSARALTDRADVQAFSPGFDPAGAALYFTTRDGGMWRLDLETLEETLLARLEGAGIGECSASADGRHIVTAFKRAGRHGLFLVDVAARTGQVIHESATLKIIHPQFHPGNPELIEYAGDPAPRLWLIRRDGTQNQCLFESTPQEFFVHESFLGRSDDLIFAVWPYRLCRLNLREKRVQTIATINAWHMSSNRAGTRIVTDTNHPDRGLLLIDPATGAVQTLCHPGASSQGAQWKLDHPAGADVWRTIRGAEGQSLSWMEMQADGVYGPQWTHPHPAFDDSGARVIYTSDRSGHPQVYVVELPSG
ncbi:MAG: oligogalacturonate lyase family protein [Lentisphaerae bacterium]|nr:oligogalacturonate lyase family protein [Lentisphaerota bacterium]